MGEFDYLMNKIKGKLRFKGHLIPKLERAVGNNTFRVSCGTHQILRQKLPFIGRESNSFQNDPSPIHNPTPPHSCCDFKAEGTTFPLLHLYAKITAPLSSSWLLRWFMECYSISGCLMICLWCLWNWVWRNVFGFLIIF